MNKNNIVNVVKIKKTWQNKTAHGIYKILQVLQENGQDFCHFGSNTLIRGVLFKSYMAICKWSATWNCVDILYKIFV